MKIGSRQRALLTAIADGAAAGRFYASVNALAAALAEKEWEISANSESMRLLLRKGFVVQDPDHPEAQAGGKGVPRLTEAGTALLTD